MAEQVLSTCGTASIAIRPQTPLVQPRETRDEWAAPAGARPRRGRAREPADPGRRAAGRQVTLRLEPTLLHVIADGKLWRTLPVSLPPDHRARLRGARIAEPPPAPATAPVRVQQRVSC